MNSWTKCEVGSKISTYHIKDVMTDVDQNIFINQGLEDIRRGYEDINKFRKLIFECKQINSVSDMVFESVILGIAFHTIAQKPEILKGFIEHLELDKESP